MVVQGAVYAARMPHGDSLRDEEDQYDQ